MTKQDLPFACFIFFYILCAVWGISDDVWNEWAPLPTPRVQLGVTSVGNQIFAIGGLSTDITSALTTVEVYNVASAMWNTSTPLPVGLHHMSVSTQNRFIYVTGGYTQGWEVSNRVFKFDLSINQWTELNPMPTARAAHTTSWVNGKLYAVGGENDSISLATNEVYDPVLDIWDILPDMPLPRSYLVSGFSNGKLFVIGGRNPYNLAVNLEFDVTTEIWTERSPMPTPRSDCAAVSYGDRIYVFGGESFEVLNNTEEYNVTEDQWKCRSAMPTARHGFVAALVGNQIFTLGGSMYTLFGGTLSPVNEVYSPASSLSPGLCESSNIAHKSNVSVFGVFLLVLYVLLL